MTIFKEEYSLDQFIKVKSGTFEPEESLLDRDDTAYAWARSPPVRHLTLQRAGALPECLFKQRALSQILDERTSHSRHKQAGIVSAASAFITPEIASTPPYLIKRGFSIEMLQ
ncbi:hypothetical protein EVAR_64195_1 [Eumeta japonica]|uniref:Uncharacterized protein n=1 Tax=Eumeta variegata TaxID=151549 RepID=A0A4C1ZFH6_EUMVA|nr:hypothetical protein EVAR_64195_1 [Eumeta japonica]